MWKYKGTIYDELDYSILPLDLHYEIISMGELEPSKNQFKWDFVIKRSIECDIAGVWYHSYRWLIEDARFEMTKETLETFNGMPLVFKQEPWNEYDDKAVAVYMLGSKLGYVPRGWTDDVNFAIRVNIEMNSILDTSRGEDLRMKTTYLQNAKGFICMPLQTDMTLAIINANIDFYKLLLPYKGHTLKFIAGHSGQIRLFTDMETVIGEFYNKYLYHKARKGKAVAGIKDVTFDNNTVLFHLRLMVKPTIPQKQRCRTMQAIMPLLQPYRENAIFTIQEEDLRKVLPDFHNHLKSIKNYLKEYYAIDLIIS